MTRLKVLVTGFGPFPGAPFNPTGQLVDRLVRLRRPALADIDLAGHVFHVSYGAVDSDLPALFATEQPDAVLMFGLAQRTPWLRVETRARNCVTMLWPDADHATKRSRAIAPSGAEALRFGPHTALLLQAARASGVPARLSRDAGRYLCNYLSWRAIEQAGRRPDSPVVAFVHVPLVARPPAHRPPVSFEELVDAGEALLLAMVRLARQRRLPAHPTA